MVVEGLNTGGAATLSAFTFGLWDGGAYKNRVDFDVSYQLAGFGRNCLIGAGALKAWELYSVWRLDRIVQTAANRASQVVGPGRGPVHGTRLHTEFAKQVKELSRGKIKPEVSYRLGEEVPRGTPGSIRVDAVAGKPEHPFRIWDLKTGSARLTSTRQQEILRHLPNRCAMKEIHPK